MRCNILGLQFFTLVVIAIFIEISADRFQNATKKLIVANHPGSSILHFIGITGYTGIEYTSQKHFNDFAVAHIKYILRAPFFRENKIQLIFKIFNFNFNSPAKLTKPLLI